MVITTGPFYILTNFLLVVNNKNSFSLRKKKEGIVLQDMGMSVCHVMSICP